MIIPAGLSNLEPLPLPEASHTRWAGRPSCTFSAKAPPLALTPGLRSGLQPTQRPASRARACGLKARGGPGHLRPRGSPVAQGPGAAAWKARRRPHAGAGLRIPSADDLPCHRLGPAAVYNSPGVVTSAAGRALLQGTRAEPAPPQLLPQFPPRPERRGHGPARPRQPLRAPPAPRAHARPPRAPGPARPRPPAARLRHRAPTPSLLRAPRRSPAGGATERSPRPERIPQEMRTPQCGRRGRERAEQRAGGVGAAAGLKYRPAREAGRVQGNQPAPRSPQSPGRPCAVGTGRRAEKKGYQVCAGYSAAP